MHPIFSPQGMIYIYILAMSYIFYTLSSFKVFGGVKTYRNTELPVIMFAQLIHYYHITIPTPYNVGNLEESRYL